MAVITENIGIVLTVAVVSLVACTIVVFVFRSGSKPGRRDPLMWSDFVKDNDQKRRRR